MIESDALMYCFCIQIREEKYKVSRKKQNDSSLRTGDSVKQFTHAQADIHFIEGFCLGALPRIQKNNIDLNEFI